MQMTVKSIDPFVTTYVVIVAAFAVICIADRVHPARAEAVTEIATTIHYDPDQIRLPG
jgi:hypothetical protein